MDLTDAPTSTMLTQGLGQEVRMTEPIIQLVDLEKKFKSKNADMYALRGINLSICQGDISASSVKVEQEKVHLYDVSTCLSALRPGVSCLKERICAVLLSAICGWRVVRWE